MPKTVFLCVNSKYIHTMLSARYLSCYVPGSVIYETNINIPRSSVLSDIAGLAPDIIAVSTYIFNIEYLLPLLADINILLPSVRIIAGGYELSRLNETRNLTKIYGEGECVIADAVAGGGAEYFGEPIDNLDKIISPYSQSYAATRDKILYFESSRGCPYRCSYCSSGGTRYRVFSLSRTFSDLQKITICAPKQVKFVDRTFNANRNRAEEIFAHIIKNYSGEATNFHFEMSPELFTDSMLEVLSKAPTGLIQFEIGLQSFNPHTLELVNRTVNMGKAEENIARLLSYKNIHIHTDLIAGLPNEDIHSFKQGFNRLFALKSDMLQLGFLKVLSGSRLEAEVEKYGYTYSASAPYEIFSSSSISYCDLTRLKTIEQALDRYYNSGRYKTAICYATQRYSDPFNFFEAFGNYLQSKGAFLGGVSAKQSSDYLYEFCSSFCDSEKLSGLIACDFAASGNVKKWRPTT